MALKLWDFECKNCESVFEDIVGDEEITTICKFCGAISDRIFTPSGMFTANQTSDWIKSVVDVVNKDDTAPHVQEFIKNPTRDNMNRWMKKEGLRHCEIGGSQHGEDYYDRKARQEKEDTHVHRMTEAVMKMRREQGRIEI